jgi:RHS repeat-associated protein
VAQDAFPNHAEKELVYDYDARGNQRLWRTPLNEAERRVVEREFAPNGTLTRRLARHTEDPTGRSYTYTHNANHSLTGFRDVQLGRTTSISFDAAERPTLIDESWDEEGSTPPAQRKSRDTLLRYDRDGNVLHRLTDGQASGDDPATFTGGKTTSFRYDDVGRETATWVCRSGGQTCDPGTGASPDRITTTSYWPSSAVRERTKPNGVVESLYFFNDNRLAQMVRKKGSATRKDQPYVYDNNGNRARDERGIHRYNARDQHAIWQRTEPAGQDKPVGSEVHYRLNGSGAMLTRRFFSDSNQQDLTRTETFRYNGDRLLDVTAEEPGKLPAEAAYCYDPTGFGEVRRIEDSGDCPADLDAALTDGDVRYRYDDLSRLIATRSGGQQDDTRFTYDGLDRRDRKIERISGADQTFEYFYVGLSERLSGEQDSGRVKVKSSDYDSKLWSQGQETKTSSTTKYRSYAIDANGSVEGLEGPDGELEEEDRYRYDPYGEQENTETGLSEDARENPLRFEGFYYDPGARTYDMHARPYRPDVGRFLTEDRFEQASGDLALLTDPLTNNRYAFAGGNPVNNIEFDGHRYYNGSHDCGCSSTEASRRNTKATTETGQLSPQQQENYAQSRAHATTVPYSWESTTPHPLIGRGGTPASQPTALSGRELQRLAEIGREKRERSGRKFGDIGDLIGGFSCEAIFVCFGDSDTVLATAGAVAATANPKGVVQKLGKEAGEQALKEFGESGARQGAGDGLTRVRHYTNRSGSEGIERDRVIRACDQGSVFCERARGNPLSPRDAETRYGLRRGRGRDYVETEVPTSWIIRRKNPLTRADELVIRWDVPLSPNARIFRRR